MNRDLDKIYYCVEREGKCQSVCFTDLTIKEIEKLTSEYGRDQWKRVALHLRDRIRDIGEKLNIISEEEED